ncbi:MAG: DinB family protein [Cyclobacteriaceae bacterium]|nr:DinB family protein [Cyclobacteriaceae bacterium HetDA_MAG_MS6]
MSLNQSASLLLTQLNEVIEQLTDHDYKSGIPILSGASIGQHIRHTLEFFICLMDGVNHDVINYDNRQHDKVIEEDRKIASSVIRSIQDFLDKNPADKALVLEANYQVEQDNTIAIPSSFLRELSYNIEHAIHHMALIKIGVRAIGDHITLSEHFGVATSTVRYQQQKV